MNHYVISKDSAHYQAWPDIALTQGGRLVCVFSECTHHLDRSWSAIFYRTSDDRGKIWSEKRPLSAPSILKETGWLWNCPRITALSDGRLVALCDRPSSEDLEASQPNYFWFSSDEGESWSDPIETPAIGICPDRLVISHRFGGGERWHLTAQRKISEAKQEVWIEHTWISDDEGKCWQGPFIIAKVPSLLLCEASLFQIPTGELICLLRENSMRGLDAFKCVSRDGGITWSKPIEFPLPGCHRPVGGPLQSGKVLITFRLCQGGSKVNWFGRMTQNFFGALTTTEACLAETREDAHTLLFPIAHDRSPLADIGYSGWVQFPDGELYIAYYLVDDHRLGHIRGCSLREGDVLLAR